MATEKVRQEQGPHKHRVAMREVCGWDGCVAPGMVCGEQLYACDGRAHGAVVYVERCRCGAVRRTESNGRFRRSLGWIFNPEV